MFDKETLEQLNAVLGLIGVALIIVLALIAGNL